MDMANSLITIGILRGNKPGVEICQTYPSDLHKIKCLLNIC